MLYCWQKCESTCEELKGRVSLWAHYFDFAEEGEGNTIGGLGESLNVPAGPGLGVPELSAGESEDVEMRGAQLPVQLLQRSVARLRLLAVTRHVYNQRSLWRHKTTKCVCKYINIIILNAPRNTYFAPKRAFNRHWITWSQFAQISSHTLIADDVDLLFLGTSPEKQSSPSRLWHRKNKNPSVFSASTAGSAGGINTPPRLSCSTRLLTLSLLSWRT